MFDCVMINDELDLLELRMNMLNDVVEHFVVVESDTTHSGREKPLYVRQEKERFSPFWHKTSLITINGNPFTTKDSSMAWGNENRQRNACVDVLNSFVPTDNLFCVCDVDEIPDPLKLMEARKLAIAAKMPVALEMHPCMYFMNYSTVTPQHRGPYVYNPLTAKEVHERFGCPDYSASMFRWHMSTPGYENDFPRVADAGWHFSTMGTIEQIRHKIKSIAHVEYDNEFHTSDEYLKQCIENGRIFANDIDRKLVKQPAEFLPKYVQANMDKYQKYVL